MKCPFRGYLLSYPPAWRRCELDSGHDGSHVLTAAGVRYEAPK